MRLGKTRWPCSAKSRSGRFGRARPAFIDSERIPRHSYKARFQCQRRLERKGGISVAILAQEKTQPPPELAIRRGRFSGTQACQSPRWRLHLDVVFPGRRFMRPIQGAKPPARTPERTATLEHVHVGRNTAMGEKQQSPVTLYSSKRARVLESSKGISSMVTVWAGSSQSVA